MTRARYAAQESTEFPNLNMSFIAIWINLFSLGMEKNIGILLIQELAVTLEIARIRSKIFLRPELFRIHKNRYGYSIGSRFRIANQTEMPLVKKSHSRH